MYNSYTLDPTNKNYTRIHPMSITSTLANTRIKFNAIATKIKASFVRKEIVKSCAQAADQMDDAIKILTISQTLLRENAGDITDVVMAGPVIIDALEKALEAATESAVADPELVKAVEAFKSLTAKAEKLHA